MNTTRIEWATMTWNPITGWSPISEGCQNCYAARMAHRLAGQCGYDKEKPFGVTLHTDKVNVPCFGKKWSDGFPMSRREIPAGLEVTQ